MNFNSRKSTKGLKKGSDGIYLDPISKQEFKKDKNGNLKMIIPELDKKLHHETINQIKNVEKKYNVDLSKKIELETRYWNEYKKAVRDWNKGVITRANTVGLRYKDMREQQKAYKTYYNKSNKNLDSDMREIKKIMTMRIKEIDGVYNGLAFDQYIRGVAHRLDMDPQVVQELLYPNGLEEQSKYEDIKAAIDKANETFESLINKKVELGELSDNEAIIINEYIDHAKELKL